MTEIREPRKSVKAAARQKYIVGEQASKNIEQVLNEYQTNLLGLSENEAMDRLVTEGENEVAHEKAPPAWKQLLTSFKNPFIFVNNKKDEPYRSHPHDIYVCFRFCE